MKLSCKNSKLMTALLISIYLMMVVTGFYCPMAADPFVFVWMAALGACLAALCISVGFFTEKLCVQLKN
ncbi:MAG: hypothetical protein AAGU74_01435 [Bacillota bacterium]